MAGTKEKLLQQELYQQVDWLSMIRNGRFLHKDPHLRHDIFSTDEIFNNWLQLAYVIKDGNIHEKNLLPSRPSEIERS